LSTGGDQAPPPPHLEDWHALETGAVLERLAASPDGLTSEEARRRLQIHGPNAAELRKPMSAWAVLRRQFASVVVWLLLVATGIAFFIGDMLEAAAIAVVLAINVIVGFWTEWRARIAVDALRGLEVHEAVVLRDGRQVEIDASEVVPGDVLVLAEGMAIPADGRLLEANELQVDEAALTGESMPAAKTTEAVSGSAVTVVGDRISMVYKGTTAVGGAGRAVVTATGAQTEIGRIGALVSAIEPTPTPIERRLDALGRRLVWLTLAVALVVIAVGLLGGRDPWLVIETGLALAIAAVPEGLPVVATITMAVGMWRMARRNALVRRPPAVEALGSATVICADKTGTLTSGHMTVTSVLAGGRPVTIPAMTEGFDAAGRLETPDVTPERFEGLTELVRTAVLANEAQLHWTTEGWERVGDPTDLALLELGVRAGVSREALVEESPEVARLPFSSRRMLMASFHRGSEGPVEVHVKGATDRVLDHCSHRWGPAGAEPLDEAGRKEILEAEHEFAAGGLRVLALVCGEADEGMVGSEDALRGLTFVGLVGLMDPPAPRVLETVARFRSAGLRTVMITGDKPATARAIAEELGILEEGGLVVSGSELASMEMPELVEVVATAAVFGRVSPEDKVRIVEALQARGEVVGMLGDGVNDAPALKRADIGVAMGKRGTDVAKGVADLVLADDRLETVGAAVEEGRVIFDNIRKFVFYLFSCNLSEVAVVLGASIVGAPLPLLPLQLLWLNVVTDVFPALALAAEPGEPDVMRRPPRLRESAILSRDFVVMLSGYALLMTVVTLAVFGWSLRVRGDEVELAVTLSFMTLAVSQLVHALNARTFGPLRLGRGLLANRWLLGALVLGVALQLLAVYLPTLQRVLGTVPLEMRDWVLVGGAGLVPLIVGQAWKRLASRNRSSSLREASGTSS
jgi:Ca2+-transporting ATPase